MSRTDMLVYERPVEPDGFATKTEAARTEIEGRIAAGETPASRDFKAIWTDFKEHFRNAQHGKCGYCEHNTEVSYYGDIEHYAPKAGIDEIQSSLVASEDRYPVVRVCERGYWWRAYDWQNYLFACAICNQRHKRCIFPVHPCPDPRDPDQDIDETPLLLNPYEPSLHPGRHLEFSELGQIIPHGRDMRGWETIRTCRLDRTALCQARLPYARRAYGLARRLQKAICRDDEPDITQIIDDLHEIGNQRAPFAGMVRIIVEQETGLPWNDLMSWRIHSRQAVPAMAE